VKIFVDVAIGTPFPLQHFRYFYVWQYRIHSRFSGLLNLLFAVKCFVKHRTKKKNISRHTRKPNNKWPPQYKLLKVTLQTQKNNLILSLHDDCKSRIAPCTPKFDIYVFVMVLFAGDMCCVFVCLYCVSCVQCVSELIVHSWLPLGLVSSYKIIQFYQWNEKKMPSLLKKTTLFWAYMMIVNPESRRAHPNLIFTCLLWFYLQET
jgi:hypothetical protein